jgi:single stranded DNA-binding protein
MSNAKLPQRQASINLFGRLTRDPELTYANDKPTCGFSIAVERWTGKERVSWFANCRVFGKPAEKFAETARKGMPAYVTGEPYMEEWTTKDGEKRKDFKCFVNTVDVLEWPEDDRPASQRAQSQYERSRTAHLPDEDAPF